MSEGAESKLYIICEGGVHTLEYINNNGIYPHKLILDLDSFNTKIAPYIAEHDKILFIIKGLTDFTLTGIYAVVRDIEKIRPTYEGVTICSNMPLGVVSFPYYLYSGDLMYSTPVLKDAKGYYTQPPKSKTKNKIKSDTLEVNEVMKELLLYNKKVTCVTYGRETVEAVAIQDPLEKRNLDAIVHVDYYKR